MAGNALKALTVALLAGVIASSYAALFYYGQAVSLEGQNQFLRSKLASVSANVDIELNFGNGTSVWFNDTYVPLGSSLLNATYYATGGRMDTKTYPFGVFVTGLMGVGSTSSSYWLWYYYDPQSGSWKEGPVGADQRTVSDGDIFLWNYTS